jgi:hypothetical protein
MKRILLHLTALAGMVSFAHGQGTIAFGNSALTRICILLPGQSARLATAADGLSIFAYYGLAGTTDAAALRQAPGAASIGATAGVMINAPSVFALPDTEPGQVVSLQIRAWNQERSVYLETDIRQVTLAPTAGPGTVIWQTTSGTNPNRFFPLCIPEPSTLALGALGGVVLIWRFRKRGTNKR